MAKTRSSRPEREGASEPEEWKDATSFFSEETPPPTGAENFGPSPAEQSKLLDLLGRIDYKILTGDDIYIYSEGIAYKILYAAYWRSVHTNAEHYLLKCEEIEENMWMKERAAFTEVELPIHYTKDGWVVENSSLKLILSRDFSFLEGRALLRIAS